MTDMCSHTNTERDYARRGLQCMDCGKFIPDSVILAKQRHSVSQQYLHNASGYRTGRTTTMLQGIIGDYSTIEFYVMALSMRHAKQLADQMMQMCKSQKLPYQWTDLGVLTVSINAHGLIRRVKFISFKHRELFMRGMDMDSFSLRWDHAAYEAAWAELDFVAELYGDQEQNRAKAIYDHKVNILSANGICNHAFETAKHLHAEKLAWRLEDAEKHMMDQTGLLQVTVVNSVDELGTALNLLKNEGKQEAKEKKRNWRSLFRRRKS